MYTWKQNLSEFSLVIGRWKSDKQARMLYWQFQVFSLNETTANIFVSAILHLLFRATNPLYIKISENKNNLRTIWSWNRQKIKNSPVSVTGSYEKKRVHFPVSIRTNQPEAHM